jgi:octaprenyl-diphosphate synthase
LSNKPKAVIDSSFNYAHHQDLYGPVNDDITVLKNNFQSFLNSNFNTFNGLTEHLSRMEGKYLRPAVFLLITRALNYPGDACNSGALAIEIMHTASLLHDDTIDDAQFRRGLPSLNNIQGDKTAIIVGDFLFASALNIAESNEEIRPIIRFYIQAIKDMSIGELQQLKLRYNINITESEHLDLVFNKTGSLFASSAAAGARLASDNSELEKKLYEMGSKMGIAFQLADDLLDYVSSEEIIGKPIGLDLRNGQYTLPVIYMLRNVSTKVKAEVSKKLLAEYIDEENLAWLIAIVKEIGGTEYAYNKAKTLIDEALNLLTILKPSKEKTHLELLIKFLIRRRY